MSSVIPWVMLYLLGFTYGWMFDLCSKEQRRYGSRAALFYFNLLGWWLRLPYLMHQVILNDKQDV